MDSDGVDGDSLFDRLRPETAFGGEWVEVYQQPLLAMARKTIAFEVSLMRVEYVLNISFAELHETMRAEVFWDSRRPSYDKTMLECGVEQALAPGDAIAWYRPVISAKSSTLGISRAAVLGTAQTVVGAAPADALRLRWMLRRDFPSEGQSAFVAAPFCTRTGILQEELGVQRPVVISFRAHAGDPERTAATEIRLLRRVPDWSIEHMAGFYLQREVWWEPYKLSPVYEEVRSGRAAYVVVGLRKLTRGPPLLPREATSSEKAFASDWDSVHNSSTCAWYLQALLGRIGVEAEVHATLDGQRLVYYQAALRRADWDRARAALDNGPWRALGVAYRRMHGGKNAPKLAVCTPKFTRHLSVDVHPTHSASKSAVGEAEDLPVVSTFVHYRDPPGLSRPRRNSDPERDTLADVD